LWKKSSCGTDSLLDYIDAGKTRTDKRIIVGFMKRGNCKVNKDSIWNLGEMTVLVENEPVWGMSSTTTQVAWHTKNAILHRGLCVSTGMIIPGNYRNTTNLISFSALCIKQCDFSCSERAESESVS
jgi:hypothetical protein